MQVLQLGALIRSKQVTSLELVKLYIERLKRCRLYFLHLSTHLVFTCANISRGEWKKGKYKVLEKKCSFGWIIFLICCFLIIYLQCIMHLQYCLALHVIEAPKELMRLSKEIPLFGAQRCSFYQCATLIQCRSNFVTERT